MKRLLAFIMILPACSIHCFGQINNKNVFCIGIDLSSPACFGTIRGSFGYGLSEKLSVGADIGLDLRCMGEAMDDTQSDHWESLEKDPYGLLDDKEFRQTFIDMNIYARYWMSKVFIGPWISVGGILKDRGNCDISIGIGYSIPVWKGLRTDVSFNLGIIETYNIGQLPSDGFRIMISYVFEY